MNEKEILNEIHRFNDGQKIALLLTIIADVSDGNLHDDEWNLIQSNLVKVKDKKDSKNNPNLVKVIDITSSSTKISNEDIQNNGREILDILISSDDFVKVAEWWKNEWYPFFWNEEGGDDTNQMGFFGDEIVPLYRTFFLNQTSLIRRWMHALCVEVFKAEDCGKEQNDIKLGWAQNFPSDIACSMNPIKIKETIKNEDGSIYEGDTISGIWHGQGKYILANGDEYEGDFFEWQLTGKGIFTWSDGDKYEGDFINGNRSGKGTFTWAESKNKYEGDFVDNKRTGKGTFTWADGDKYEGDFVDSKRTGKGIYTWADGDKYEGDFINGNRSGKGTFTWADGDKYEGDFLEDKFHGKGVCSYTSGDIFEGNFVEGKKKGHGVHTWPDGSKFEGEITGGHSDKPKANIDTGIFTWPDGEKFEGYCYQAMSSMNQFTLKNKPTISSDKLLEIAKNTSVDESELKSIAARTDLDNNCRELVDLKINLQEQSEWKRQSSKEWIEKTGISIKEWSNDIFESLASDKSITIRSAILANPFLPKNILTETMKKEHITFDEKMSVLKNPSCSQELLTVFSKDVKNYSSSRLRKKVAMHPSTPKEIVNQLLEDEYLWVRQAAAQNSNLKQNEIDRILDEMNKKYPSVHTYQIKSNGYGIVESTGGSVSIDDVIEAIQSGEDDWNSYAYSDFYEWSDAWQVYGPNSKVDTVVYPDGSEESFGAIKGKFEYDSFTAEEGSKDFDGEFFQVASSAESGSWIYYDFELVGEFNPDCLTAIYDEEAPASEEIIKRYLYNNEEFEDDTEIEIDGEFDESSGKGTEIEFYVNTDDGLQYCDDFYDMRSEMEEKGLDPESEEDIRAYLKKKYNLEKEEKE